MTRNRMLAMKKMVVKMMMVVMMEMMVMVMVMNMRMVGKIPRLWHRVASETTSVAFLSLKGPHSHLTRGKSLFKA